MSENQALAPVTLAAECDWGYCDKPAVAFRNDAEGYGWLPVCKDHVSADPAQMAWICLTCASEPCLCHLSPEEQRAHYAQAVERAR